MCNLDGEDLLKTAELKREKVELEESLKSVSLFENPAGEFHLIIVFRVVLPSPNGGNRGPCSRSSAVFCSLRTARVAVTSGRSDSRGER